MTTRASAASQTEVSESYSYNDCCYAADCCCTGGGEVFYSADQTAAYMYCASYDIQMSCLGSDASFEFVGCVGADGMMAAVASQTVDTLVVLLESDEDISVANS